jgi:3-oxoadipate enol-lactonase
MPEFLNRYKQELYYLDKGEGMPLVLIHGLGGSHKIFEKQIDELAKEFRCISVDLRGYGKSDNLGLNCNFDDLAGDVLDLLNELNIEKAYFLGISMGGILTQSIMINNPQVIKKAVLVSTTPSFEYDNETINIDFIREMDFNVDRIAELAGVSAFPDDRDLVERESYIKEYQLNRSETLRSNYEDLRKLNNIEKLKKVEVDTLIIHGEDDPIINLLFAKLMNRLLKRATLVTMKNVGHTPHRNSPYILSQIVKDYLESD